MMQDKLVERHQNDFGAVTGLTFPDDSTTYSPAYCISQCLRLHAKRTPDRVCLRLPAMDVDQAQHAFIDVTYGRAAVIVDALAEKLQATFDQKGIPAGRGTSIAVLTLPYCLSLFHIYALWQLGYAVQLFNHDMGREVVDKLLEAGGSKAILIAGLTGEEERELGMAGMDERIGVKPVWIADEDLAHRLAQSESQRKPQEPMPVAEFDRSGLAETPFVMTHTSGSTGIPKVIKWDRFGLGTQLKPLFKAEKSFLNVSRIYWSTAILILVNTSTSGGVLIFMSPKDRIYPTTQEVLENIAVTQPAGTLLFAGQAHELLQAITSDARNARIVSSIKLLAFAGVGMDQATNEVVEEIGRQTKIVIMNGHGLAEVMGTGLITVQPPYHGLSSLSDSLLLQPLPDDEQEQEGRLVKLWISMDRSPILWYQFVRGYAPNLKPQRYPGPGAMHDRPAHDTGDLFIERKMADGRTLYFHHARDDDMIRLSNLYRPHVQDLEGDISARLLKISSGRLRPDDLDTVQVLGDKKAKLAVVVQLREGAKVDENRALECIKQTLDELDEKLPKAVRFDGDMKRVYLVSSRLPGQPVLLMTHKGNLRRRVNTTAFSTWLDSVVKP